MAQQQQQQQQQQLQKILNPCRREYERLHLIKHLTDPIEIRRQIQEL